MEHLNNPKYRYTRLANGERIEDRLGPSKTGEIVKALVLVGLLVAWLLWSIPS